MSPNSIAEHTQGELTNMPTEHAIHWVVDQRDGYRIHQSGNHQCGTYIRVYVPDSATQPGAPLKSILYLHGFALCIPEFYELHMIQLVKEGYIVFFPDFQPSYYRTTLPSDSPQRRVEEETSHLKRWYAIATRKNLTQREDHRLGADEILALDQETTVAPVAQQDETRLGPGLDEPKDNDVRRVAWVLLIVLVLFKVVGFIRQEYGRNIIHLLSTVGISLFQYPTSWLSNAIQLTEKAWQELSVDYPHWDQVAVESFAFGHSIGGLIALSLPSNLSETNDPRVVPKQIVAADPAPSTLMGIPRIAIWILTLLRSRFTQQPVQIAQTGPQVNVPVTILHGASDRLVPPSQWLSGSPSSYDAINGRADKAIYFSCSNRPDLVAFHNQAVTSTQFYGDGLMREFGGVKDGVNAYNCEYIWPGLELLISGRVKPSTLLSQLQPDDFDVKTELPSSSIMVMNRLIKLLPFMGLLALGWAVVR